MCDENCRTDFIEDIPLQESTATYQNQGILKIASGISNLIKREHYCGKTISIEGCWGTGKTSVINSIINELKPDPHITSVYIDTWNYSKDPIRTVLLLKLIKALTPEVVDKVNLGLRNEPNNLDSYAQPITLNDIIMMLTGQTHQERVNEPIQTKYSTIIILQLFVALTIGVVFLKSGIDTLTFSNNWYGLVFNWKFFIGCLFSLTPLVTFTIVLLGKKNKDFMNWLGIKEGQSLSNPFAQKTQTIERMHFITSVNPTVLEFEEIFDKILRFGFPNNSINKIVLIFDNMDRLNPEEAIQIFSSLQMFIHETGGGKKYSNLWILIPCDLSRLNNLWQFSNYEPRENNITYAMLEKRFHLRFQIPSLLIIEWKDYFHRMLAKAFPDHKSFEFHEVYLVFLEFLTPNTTPTFREIITYINCISALHYMFTSFNIPLDHFAYYVSISKKFTEKEAVIDAITTNRVESINYVIENDLASSLAAIYYYSPRDTALSDTLRMLIKDSILTENLLLFSKLAENRPGDFWDILQTENIIMTEGNFHSIAWLLNTISKRLIPSIDPVIIEKITRKLAMHIVHGPGWKTIDEDISGATLTAARVYPQFASKIIDQIKNIHLSIDTKDSGRPSTPAIYILVREINTYLELIIPILKELTLQNNRKLLGQLFPYTDAYTYIVFWFVITSNNSVFRDYSTYFRQKANWVPLRVEDALQYLLKNSSGSQLIDLLNKSGSNIVKFVKYLKSKNSLANFSNLDITPAKSEEKS